MTNEEVIEDLLNSLKEVTPGDELFIQIVKPDGSRTIHFFQVTDQKIKFVGTLSQLPKEQ